MAHPSLVLARVGAQRIWSSEGSNSREEIFLFTHTTNTALCGPPAPAQNVRQNALAKQERECNLRLALRLLCGPHRNCKTVRTLDGSLLQ